MRGRVLAVVMTGAVLAGGCGQVSASTNAATDGEAKAICFIVGLGEVPTALLPPSKQMQHDPKYHDLDADLEGWQQAVYVSGQGSPAASSDMARVLADCAADGDSG